jgi:hypothetical protein
MSITIIDTDVPLTAAKLAQLKAQGIVSIGRYLNRRNPSGDKVIKPAEARLFQACGMRLFLIYEFDGKPSGPAVGAADGAWSAAYAPTVGAPTDGSAFIAYTVDYDAPEADMPGIKAAFTEFSAAIKPKFTTWAYASGAVNASLLAAKLITGRWLTCSSGFRGSKQALAAGDYEMRQAIPQEIAGLDTDPDSTHVANMMIGFVPFASATSVDAPKPAPSSSTAAASAPKAAAPAAAIIAPATGWFARFRQRLGLA